MKISDENNISNAWSRRGLLLSIKYLFPGYFTLVMATGIISLAALLWEALWIAKSLYILNWSFYLILFCILVFRLLVYWPEFWSDLKSHQRGPGFFSLVAASCILGVQVLMFDGSQFLVWALYCFALLAWILINYSFFVSITTCEDKPDLVQGINGAWLISVVAMQALSNLGTELSPLLGSQWQAILLFMSLGFFLGGVMFYIIIMGMIVYRLSFFDLEPTALGAPYWINMGATAISTLAGCSLILHGGQWQLLEELTPFIKGLTLLYWYVGTGLVPLLFLLGIWRHAMKRVPVPFTSKGYGPGYWGLVFPLGMYTVCTYQLSEVINLPFLKSISEGFTYVSYISWALVFLGLIGSMVNWIHGKDQV